MKTARMLTICVLALGLMVCWAQSASAAPMGTAFTYQGHLMDKKKPANGLYDFQFSIYDDPNVIDGNQVGDTLDINDLDVVKGYFTVELDFGSDVFDGNAVWLETGVRPGDLEDPNVYTTLSPRLELTPTPYAIYAETAGGDNDWMISDSNMYSIPSGNVGIGTTSPSEKLEVDHGNLLVQGVGSFDSFGDEARVYLGDTNHYIKSVFDFGVKIGTFGVGDVVSIRESSGNVGIGTTSPAAKLEVNGEIKITDGSQAAGKVLTSDAGGLASWQTPSAGGDSDWIISGNDMYSNVSGNVGIGTTSPSDRLTVKGTVLVSKSYGATGPGLKVLRRFAPPMFGNTRTEIDATSINAYWSSMTTVGTDLSLNDDSAGNVLLAEGGGNVGIGTDNPGAMLEVNGQIKITGGSPGADKVLTSNATGLASWQTGGGFTLPYVGSTSSSGDAFKITNTASGSYAVHGSGGRIGVRGNTGGSDDAYGGYFTASGTKGTGVGAKGGSDGYAGYFDGKVRISKMVPLAFGAVPVFWNPIGKHSIGVLVSSARFKEDIKPLNDDFHRILDAEPKSFTWKENGGKGIGFIAEEFDALGLTNLVYYEDGQPFSIKYNFVPLYLLEVMKDQVKVTEKLRAENEQLKQRVEALEEMMQQHSSRLMKGVQ